MQAAGTVFDFVIELTECLYPAGKQALWTFEGPQPLKAVVVRPQNGPISQQVVPEMLH